MKIQTTLSCIALAVAGLVSAPAMAAADYSLTFQGVTFEIDLLDADSLSLTMLGTDAATGDWSGSTTVRAFMLKDIGSFTGATVTGPDTFVYSKRELTANGCVGGPPGGSPQFACFTGSIGVAPSLSWTIDFDAPLSVAAAGPHLKVNFMGPGDTNARGSLLSQTIPVIPEPETYALMLAGLAAIGFVARRRRG